jgi:outer membrane protein OmpA-like peptidoglycan-associated protein
MKLSRARILSRIGTPAAAVTLMLGLAGCETAPPSGGLLEEARNAVAQAEANPNVSKYAPTELDRARKLLINAESSAKEKGVKDPTAAHYAYLTTQLARIAEQRANEQVATARIKAGETERQQILLTAREAEASSALAQARAAQEQAQAAQQNAQSAQQQAQVAQQQVAQAEADRAQAEAERQRLAAQLEEMQAAQTSRGIVLTLDDVLFDTGRAELKPGAQRSIDQIASFLQEHPERRVQVEGFTDSQGSDDYNLELSQSRADAVALAIIQRGVDAQRVRALGYGEQFPVASNNNAGSRQLNRRVEIVVGNENAPIPGRTAAGSP